MKASATVSSMVWAILVATSIIGVVSPQRARAQSGPYAGAYNVVSVEVKGARTATVDLIKSVANIPPGTALNTGVTRDAVSRLNGLGMFEEVTVLGEETTGGINIYILVKEYPKLGKVTFQGADKVKASDLKDKVKLNEGAYLSPFLITSKKDALLKLYGEKGYFLTEISSSLAYSADSSLASLTYTINERDKVKVRSVFVRGAQRMDSSKLVGAMSNRKKGFLRSSNYNRDKYQEDLEKVAQEFQKYGFADAYVVSDSVFIDSIANRLDIHIEAYEGPKYYFGVDSFIDATIYTPELLKKALKHKRYDVFSQEKYEESVGEVYSAYQERGYLHTRVQDDRVVRDSFINTNYTITEGLPSKINLISIVGNSKTKDHVIRREFSSQPGQVFSRSLLIRSVRDVMALNYFSNVTPDVKDLPNGDIDLDVKIEEKQTGQLNAGAGYSARDKLVGNFGMGIPNLFGYGQSANFNIEFGGRRNSKSISFTEPWLFGKPTLLGTDLFSTNRRYEGIYTEGRRGGSLRLGKRLKWPDNYFRASLSYRIEGNRFYDFDATYKSANLPFVDTVFSFVRQDTVGTGIRDTTIVERIKRVSGEPDPGTLLSLGESWNMASILSFSVNRDSRNLPEFATAGSQFRYSVAVAGGALGGYWRYHKHTTEFTKYFRLYKNIALTAQVQAGAIGIRGDPHRVLESERFSPGGTGYYGIVRGYRDGSLTPDSSTRGGDSTITVRRNLDSSYTITSAVSSGSSVRARSNYLLVSNFEITLPLAKNQFYFLTFFDAGNSWQQFDHIRPITDLYSGAGVGFRLVVPGIGTVGFDFARPLRKRVVNGILEDQGWRTHFQMGTIFQ